MESKPSPISLTPEQQQKAEEVRLNAVRKRTGAFQADLVELEKKHGLRLIAVLNQSHKGIFPGMICVDPDDHPEYAAPHMEKPEEPKKKKVLKKKD